MSLPRLSRRDLARVALRTSLLQATWNYERQQGLGWAYAIEPAIERLCPDAASRNARLAEHTAYFNTQPTLASVAIGAVLGIEAERAAGGGPNADGVSRIKAVLGSALAALGDRLFWFALRPFAALLGVCIALSGSGSGALALWLCYNLVHQPLRWYGVQWGYAQGPSILSGRLRPRLERLTRVLGAGGSALVGITIALSLVPGGTPRPILYQILLALGLAGGVVAAQRARPSPTVWALLIGVACVGAVWRR